MTRKDYVLIAKSIAGLPERPAKHTIAFEIAYVLEQENHRFDSVKFMDVCLEKELKQ